MFVSGLELAGGPLRAAGAATAGTITGFPAGIAPGPDGNLWFTELGADRIGRITPGAPNTITEFDVPTAAPEDIATGPDANLWFSGGDTIGRMAADAPQPSPNSPSRRPAASRRGSWPGPPATCGSPSSAGGSGGSHRAPDTISEFPVPTDGSAPRGIVAGPDGNLWFTEFGANRIGRITPGAPNTITEFPVPTAGSVPRAITIGPDGNLWFAELAANRIGRITPAAPSTIAEFPLGEVTAVAFRRHEDGCLPQYPR